eukprot:Nk52_evm67s32 gene=Nk52_evmTU67s32
MVEVSEAGLLLKFLVGLDLSAVPQYEAQNWASKEVIEHFPNLVSLKLKNNGLESLPEGLDKLSKLEEINLGDNKISQLENNQFGELSELQVLSLNKNQLKGECIDEIPISDLLILDLSNNQMKEMRLSAASSDLIMLCLSNNQIKKIEGSMFAKLKRIKYLDLSNNALESIPAQLCRLIQLRTLKLGGNNLVASSLRPIFSLTKLSVVDLRNTGRNQMNLTNEWGKFQCLKELDLSQNSIEVIPSSMCKLGRLQRLLLSSNQLRELPMEISNLERLRVLNVADNRLVSIPESICTLQYLERLTVMCNDIATLPENLGSLRVLKYLNASNNRLRCLPEELFECEALTSLCVDNNDIEHIPSAVHLLKDLQVFKYRGNEGIVVDKVDNKLSLSSTIDIERQKKNARSKQPEGKIMGRRLSDSLRNNEGNVMNILSNIRDANFEKRHPELSGSALPKSEDSDADTLLSGMKKQADGHIESISEAKETGEEEDVDKRLDNEIVKHDIDYSGIFEDFVGNAPGVLIWRIENFYPALIEDDEIGTFYQQDCYIILCTMTTGKDGTLSHEIFYWVGGDTQLDKKTCVAMHSVHLKEHLNVAGRNHREEEGDESDEFLSIFGGNVVYVSGGSESGFYPVEEPAHNIRMFKILGSKTTLNVVPVDISIATLTDDALYFFDVGKELHLYCGRLCNPVVVSKARMLVADILKNERKGKGEEVLCHDDEDDREAFEEYLGELDLSVDKRKFQSEDFQPKLFCVELEKGAVKMPQQPILSANGKPVLESKKVYILDSLTDIYVWCGTKSSRLHRVCALRLARDMCRLLPRPSYALVVRVFEGVEQEIFKARYAHWSMKVESSFSEMGKKLAQGDARLESLSRTGSAVDQEQNGIGPDFTALFMPKTEAPSNEELAAFRQENVELLDNMEAFVLEEKKFVKLPETDIGHFYEGDCYVFLCTYWNSKEKEEEMEGNGDKGKDKDGEEEEEEDYIEKCNVYFWQGRNASMMGWLTFTFTFQHDVEKLIGENFGCELNFIKVMQQKEPVEFLCHFDFTTIHKGIRPIGDTLSYLGGKSESAKLFHVAHKSTKLATRCVQVPCHALFIFTNYSYILVVQGELDDNEKIIHVIPGKDCSESEKSLASAIGLSFSNEMSHDVNTTPLDTQGIERLAKYIRGDLNKQCIKNPVLDNSRLFKCSNSKGYFEVTEVVLDFCQDDLEADCAMVLDSAGRKVYLWLGNSISESVKELGMYAAKEYAKSINIKSKSKPYIVVAQGEEPRAFTCAFHGWGKQQQGP